MPKKVSIEATLQRLPKGVQAIPRAQVTYRYRYTLQTLSEGGGWSDSLSTDDWNTVAGQAEFAHGRGVGCRVVFNGEPDKETGA